MDAHVHIQMKCVHEQRLPQRLEEQEKPDVSQADQCKQLVTFIRVEELSSPVKWLRVIDTSRRSQMQGPRADKNKDDLMNQNEELSRVYKMDLGE